MLSKDELRGGMTFILKLWDAVGVPTQWIETLKGAAARRWYGIYRRSDWEALRTEAAGVFRHRVTDEAVRELLKQPKRCIYIHTLMVEPAELVESELLAGCASPRS
jgi:hypothetical protein